MNTELIAQVRLYSGEGVQTDAARQAQRKIADALEAAQPKEPMVTPYISQAHFDRAFPDTAAQPAGEPVAWMWVYSSCGGAVRDGKVLTDTPNAPVWLQNMLPTGPQPVYLHPAAPQVPMTDAQLDQLMFDCGLSASARDIARAIEAHFKIGVKP